MPQTYRKAAVAALVAAVLGAAGLCAAEESDVPANQEQTPATTDAPVEGAGVSAPGEAAATVLDKKDVQGILGRPVVSSTGEDMGRVIDVVVDRNGLVRAAVIDFGGFLGVGSRKIALDWSVLHFAPTGGKEDRITLDLTRDQVKAAPEYRDGRPLVMLGATESLQPSRSPY